MGKTYAEMTPAERIADRIAKNKAIDANIKASQPAPAPTPVRVPRWFTPQVARLADAICADRAANLKPVIVKCWTRDIIIPYSHAETIKAALREKLAAWKANGSPRTCRSRTGWNTVSVQTAINLVRDRLDLSFPTSHGDAEKVLEALGFTLERLGDGHTTIITGEK